MGKVRTIACFQRMTKGKCAPGGVFSLASRSPARYTANAFRHSRRDGAVYDALNILRVKNQNPCGASMSVPSRSFRAAADDFKRLLRSIPAPTVTIFVLSVVCANLMANKELVSSRWVALDCGFAFSWIMFLCMDVVCRRWGAAASVKLSLFALAVNLAVCASFALLSLAPGRWGAYYATENPAVNEALDATFGGAWYVVVGSATAFLASAVVNAFLNGRIARALDRRDRKGFGAFALCSWASTLVAQLVDNLLFATLVSKLFFGWTWTQVFVCSAIGAGCELLGEVFFSGVGYRLVVRWERESVGADYLAERAGA